MHIPVATLMTGASVTLVLALTVAAQGQTLAVRHPVLDHGIDPGRAAQYEAVVERIMAMGEEEMLSFLPDWSYAMTCECPHCYGGVQGYGVFSWTIDRSEEITCRHCGTSYPDPRYPEEHSITGTNALGEEITFPYHHATERDRPHFLSMHTLLHRRQWLEGQVVALGMAYQATGKEEYARRVALVLDKLARRYPHYPVMQNRSPNLRFRDSQEVPFEWDSGKWGNFHNEIPWSMVRAYDLVCESPEFDRLSAERGYDVRERLEQDCFRATFEAIALSPYHVSNVVGYDITSAALLGRVLSDPEMVHHAFRWIKRNLDEGFFRDGMWYEGTPDYHSMTIGGLRAAFRSLEGYSDPAGYVDPVDGARFDDFDPVAQLPFWGKAIGASDPMDRPTGLRSAFHDSHPYSRGSGPRHETTSAILPAMGHASLGRGRGLHQMQAQLHFSGAYGHAHADNLDFSLFARGREMLPDLGYTWTQMRWWTTSSASHNLVVVDRENQTMGASDGDLVCYFPDTAGVSVVEADGRRGYRNAQGLDLYRRMLVMVPVSRADAYVVDIFRVRGGDMHDWMLNGDADEDTVASSTVPLEGRREWMLKEGEEWVEPTLSSHRYHPYGMLRDMARGETDEGFQVSFAYTGGPPAGLRMHMTGGESREVWLGRAPSVRRAQRDMRLAWDFWMPKLMVRRQGEAPLHSIFAAVHEPHGETPLISSVERLELTPGDENAVALRITHGDTVDTVISTLDEPPFPERVTPDGMALRGRLGLVRQVAGRTTGAWLFDGEQFRGEGWGLETAAGRMEGTVDAVTRRADGDPEDAFLTHADLPPGETLRGAWMIVTHSTGHAGGYEISRVEKRGDTTAIILADDPGLRMEDGETREVYFPLRTFQGVNQFVIPLAAAFAGEELGE